MTFLLDQDVPDPVARVLKQARFDVQRVRELLPPDSADEAVLALAHSRRSLLVTCNRDDFLSLAKTKPHAGIIVLIRRQTRIAECSALLRLLQSAGDDGLSNNINFA